MKLAINTKERSSQAEMAAKAWQTSKRWRHQGVIYEMTGIDLKGEMLILDLNEIEL